MQRGSGGSFFCRLVNRYLEAGINCSSQWAELRTVRLGLMITQAPWLLSLCINCWAVLKRLTYGLDHGKLSGGITIDIPWGSQDRYKDFWVCLQEPTAVLIIFQGLAQNALTPPDIRKPRP